jgi:hypothetical protein
MDEILASEPSPTVKPGLDQHAPSDSEVPSGIHDGKQHRATNCSEVNHGGR